MPDIETASPAPGQVADVSAPSSQEFGGEDAHSTAPEAGGNGQTNGEAQKPQSHQQKRESRYERTKRQRAELQKRESALKEREERIAHLERAKQAPRKPEYTLDDLKQFRPMWEQEGRFDVVEKADQEIARLEKLEQQEKGQQSFQEEWQQVERELGEADPEFGFGKGTRLDKKLGEIMQSPDGNIYRQHPRGIVAAYHRAKMEILEGDHKVALEKIQQLETELKRVTGLSSIGGGVPGRVGSGNRVESLSDFKKLSSADMRKYLLSSKSGRPLV